MSEDLLEPGANIMHTPLTGHNFDYLSEDPYLSAPFDSEVANKLNLAMPFAQDQLLTALLKQTRTP